MTARQSTRATTAVPACIGQCAHAAARAGAPHSRVHAVGVAAEGGQRAGVLQVPQLDAVVPAAAQEHAAPHRVPIQAVHLHAQAMLKPIVSELWCCRYCSPVLPPQLPQERVLRSATPPRSARIPAHMALGQEGAGGPAT